MPYNRYSKNRKNMIYIDVRINVSSTKDEIKFLDIIILVQNNGIVEKKTRIAKS